jgi:membrane protein DedA with SNARE-associated domain
MPLDLNWFSLETLEAIGHDYGYGAVFSGILFENLGLPLPGEAIVLVGGFLAGRGELSLTGVIVSAIAGATIGNTLGYWLGVYGGWPLLLRVGQLFKVEESRLVSLKERFAKNAGRAVLLGRFVTLFRIFAGPLAGIVEMPFWRFTLYNVTGAVLWATVMVTLAFFTGELVPLDKLMAWVGQFGLVILGAIALWFAVPSLWRVVSRWITWPISKSETP